MRVIKKLDDDKAVELAPGISEKPKASNMQWPRSRLSPKDIENIKHMVSLGYTYRAIAKQYHVSVSLISRIMRKDYAYLYNVEREETEKAMQALDDNKLFTPHVYSIASGLWSLHEMQTYISGLSEGAIPEDNEHPTPEQIRGAFLALIVETSELLQQLDWKPWKSREIVDADLVIDEFADILAFLGLIIVLLGNMGINPDMLAMGYLHKSEVNVARLLGQVENYTTRARSKKAEEAYRKLITDSK